LSPTSVGPVISHPWYSIILSLPVCIPLGFFFGIVCVYCWGFPLILIKICIVNKYPETIWICQIPLDKFTKIVKLFWTTMSGATQSGSKANRRLSLSIAPGGFLNSS
jgi:hypothetical protein